MYFSSVSCYYIEYTTDFAVRQTFPLYFRCLAAGIWVKGGESMEGFLMSIGNYGFPMVVTAYLLVRIEGRLEDLDRSLHQLTRAVENKSDIFKGE